MLSLSGGCESLAEEEAAGRGYDWDFISRPAAGLAAGPAERAAGAPNLKVAVQAGLVETMSSVQMSSCSCPGIW